MSITLSVRRLLATGAITVVVGSGVLAGTGEANAARKCQLRPVRADRLREELQPSVSRLDQPGRLPLGNEHACHHRRPHSPRRARLLLVWHSSLNISLAGVGTAEAKLHLKCRNSLVSVEPWDELIDQPPSAPISRRVAAGTSHPRRGARRRRGRCLRSVVC